MRMPNKPKFVLLFLFNSLLLLSAYSKAAYCSATFTMPAYHIVSSTHVASGQYEYVLVKTPIYNVAIPDGYESKVSICGTSSVCSIRVQGEVADYVVALVDNAPGVILSPGDTWPKLASANTLYDKMPSTTTVVANATVKCFRMILSRSGISANVQPAFLAPYETCGATPPIGENCVITTPGPLSFSYGNLTKKNASGSMLSEAVSINCSSNIDFSLSLGNTNGEIMLSNGMSAVIDVNGLTAGTKISGVKGEQNVIIKSLLSGTPIAEGPFTGTGVLYVEYF